MTDWAYTEEELNEYFSDPTSRKKGHSGKSPNRQAGKRPGNRGVRGYLARRLEDPKVKQAYLAFSILAAFFAIVTAGMGIYLLTLADDLPSFEQLDNPYLRFASIAYTSDGEELAAYGSEYRTWVAYEEISPHVINALISSEDHRFYDHWGVDLFRTASAILHTLLGDTQGGSTITQQLARNLYNEQIGRKQTPGRKLKEMVTAIQLERRYTKHEIIEMYLNTVEFGQNAFGIEAAAHTFFGKPAFLLDVEESATLVGVLRAINYYNPFRHPERAKWVRNVVLGQLRKHGFISSEYFNEHRDDPLELNPDPVSPRRGLAPHFAEYVRRLLEEWGDRNGYNIYSDGLVVYTTIDSRIQNAARTAVEEQLRGLQAVMDFEWSQPDLVYLGAEVDTYLQQDQYDRFAYFWESKGLLVSTFIQETDRYMRLRASGMGHYAAIEQLREDESFMDSLKTAKTTLESGLVAIDPRNGQIKAWVGARDPEREWYDHVSSARRQPGSTFKPFVYTAAIDNGYSPDYLLPDSAFVYRDPVTGYEWAPSNFGGETTGGMMTLREALARSNNLITARIITQLINPSEVARYAYRMGIKSTLSPVPSLGLGTSEVTLLELTSAYCTLANGGLYYEPRVITRIEDRFGNVLYEGQAIPEREALSPQTAYTVVDMLRGAVEYGTAASLRARFGLHDYDLAAKTGTTQDGADGWFMLMHPQLVTGAWVGFNDRRVTFRSDQWGQGGRTALLPVGDFFRNIVDLENPPVTTERFPSGIEYTEDRDGRVGW